MKISLSPTGRHFAKQDGTPFFWLADTAWNAALRGDTDEWHRYLSTRSRQKFTVIQFVATPWRGCRQPLHGPLFRQSADGVSFDERAWGKMEEWMSLIVEYGMVPAPVMIWDNNPDEDFFRFRADTCIETGRRMLQRWRAYHPIWILGGDGDYRSREQDEKWKSIGRAVFGDFPEEIATTHPCGTTWVADNYATEAWYSFVGVQSGHGSSDYDLRFLLNGPYSYRWAELKKPFVNLEPNYEFATSYHNHQLAYSDYHVRRAAWWSVLGAPPAGVTYGSNIIWIWPVTRYEAAEGHGDSWAAGHWTTGLETPGIDSMTTMMEILAELPWTELLPADELLHEQPGWDRPENYIKVAATPDRGVVLAYLPRQKSVSFCAGLLGGDVTARWIDPRTGARQPASPCFEKGRIEVSAPNGWDWVLLLQKE